MCRIALAESYHESYMKNTVIRGHRQYQTAFSLSHSAPAHCHAARSVCLGNPLATRCALPKGVYYLTLSYLSLRPHEHKGRAVPHAAGRPERSETDEHPRRHLAQLVAHAEQASPPKASLALALCSIIEDERGAAVEPARLDARREAAPTELGFGLEGAALDRLLPSHRVARSDGRRLPATLL